MLPIDHLIDLARNPVPAGASVGLYETFDGRRLRYAHWHATRAPLRGTVVILQGRSEFIEKYFEVVADLRRRGFAVATFDLRGQGGSERLLKDPRRGHVRSFRDYEEDLSGFLKDIVQTYLPQPYIGLGHSLGGNILLRYALRKSAAFDRLVLTAPMIQISPKQIRMAPGLARGLAEVGSLLLGPGAYVPGQKRGAFDRVRFEDNLLTSDRERYQRMQAVIDTEPLLALGPPTLGWMRAAFRSMAQLQHAETPRRIGIPMLIASAGDDEIVSTLAIENFAVRTKLASRILISTSRHEILQENDDIRSRFWAAFDAYFMPEPQHQQA